MSEKAILQCNGKTLELDVTTGSEGEKGIDISQLRAKTGCITMDPGYGNTGSCVSNITFIDGEEGILRYRGYPIEQLAEHATFVEVAYLVLYGELPTQEQLTQFRAELGKHAPIHTSLLNHYNGFPNDAPPMAILSAMLNAVACYNPKVLKVISEGPEFDQTAVLLMSKVRTISACAYRMANGMPFNHPNINLGYCGNFLHMMFSKPYDEYKVHPEVERALNLFLILHADHEQNCSTSTVRMVGSARANLFSSVAAGVCALWGPLHGGANVEVIEMLEGIHKHGKPISYYIELAKDKENPYKLMGFGHRVYKNFDPRARVLKEQVDKVLKALNIKDPLLDIAVELEDRVLQDDYFAQRKLYPNVDFYSGILLRAIGIPTNMYTVMFAIGRMPGWIANWRELLSQNQRISRPRQIYTGATCRNFLPMSAR